MLNSRQGCTVFTASIIVVHTNSSHGAPTQQFLLAMHQKSANNDSFSFFKNGITAQQMHHFNATQRLTLSISQQWHVITLQIHRISSSQVKKQCLTTKLATKNIPNCDRNRYGILGCD
ncbi:hypothetical protein V8G54_023606 [Vigna mungo]|uniref:Uncharacterized protein n=1 Tax=Vigna mungo TaxID=3915 RepID=A0AAQ3N5I1_VIGMU